MKKNPRLLLTSLLALVSFGAHAGYSDFNMPVGVTPISREVYDLHMLILIICVVIGVGVFGAMFYSMFMHRKSMGAKAAHFHHSTKAEIIWTVIPCLILIVMAWPATQALIKIEDDSNPDITLKVTAFQWAWKYEYIDEGISFYSVLDEASRAAIYGDPMSRPNYLLEVDNPVVVPIGKKIRLLLTADDVLHAWWVPEFGMKRDAIPGFVTQMWFMAEKTGTYRGQCAELCGKDHGFMPIVVIVKSEEEYAKWVAEQQAAAAPNSDAKAASAAVTEPAPKGTALAAAMAR